ncbi:MAG: pre-peptidase C-terminal domain-containing protein [Isosphaeraceae bacterium]
MSPQRQSTTRASRRLRRSPSRRPCLEWLDRRTLPAASPLTLAPALHFKAHNEVRLPQRYLATSSEVDLYATTLQAGDTIDARIVAASAGSGLTSLLRVFDAGGRPLALDDREGGDPRLTFQAATTGTYYIGVSSAPNNNYNPAGPGSGTKGGTTGLYELDVRLAHAAPLLPDVTGSSFRTGADTAAPGDTIPVNFTVENRGGADPGPFQVEVLLSRSNRFDASSQVLATFPRAALVPAANGRGFSSPAGFAVTLPEGLASGNAFLGLRVVADPSAPQAGKYDKSGVHRGSDLETLTLVTPGAEGATDLAKIDAGLRTAVTGYLGLYPTAVYTVTVGDDLGNGAFTAAVSGSDGFRPRLTLSGPTGQTLIQSDSGRLVQRSRRGPCPHRHAAGRGGRLPAHDLVHGGQPAPGPSHHRRDAADWGRGRPDQRRHPRRGRAQLRRRHDQPFHGQRRRDVPDPGRHPCP